MHIERFIDLRLLEYILRLKKHAIRYTMRLANDDFDISMIQSDHIGPS